MAGRWARARKGLLKRGWARRLLTPLGRDLRPARWIFVVGCYNSGTTLLRDLLGRHPDIDVLPAEGVRLADGWPRPEERGWHRMWCRCVEHVRLPVEGGAERAAQVRRQWSLALPRDTANVLEKSIANAARLPYLAAHFRPAYVIHLVRNGYAVAEGIRRKGEPLRFGHSEWGDRYPIRMAAEQWRASMELVAEDAPALERFLEVRYEDLAADAEQVLARIMGFLDLPPLDAAAARGAFDIHGVRSGIRDMNPDSLARLSAQDFDEIDAVAGTCLQRWGYARS